MLPIRWDPIRDLNSLQRELDDVMRRVFGVTRESQAGMLTATPTINTYVKEGMFHVEAELPGVDTDKLDVRIDGKDLWIKGERHLSRKAEEADFLIRESRFSSFERRLPLPDGVDTEKTHASYKDGLLEVTMPITTKAAGGRKILVEGLETAKKSKEVH